ncbi:MAG: hypothetical protein GY865_14815 [candidate division Zixibacteria bacterium]|nr:hypothetical protein [candidate division Zixibacteria bacterium]
MAVVLSIIGAVLLWNDRPACMYLFIIASCFLVCGIVFPKLLYPIECIWMKLAFVIGAISTRIILIIVYYLAVTPIGLLRQLFSKDPLDIKIDKSTESYWKPVDHKDSKSRFYKPY